MPKRSKNSPTILPSKLSPENFCEKSATILILLCPKFFCQKTFAKKEPKSILLLFCPHNFPQKSFAKKLLPERSNFLQVFSNFPADKISPLGHNTITYTPRSHYGNFHSGAGKYDAFSLKLNMAAGNS